MVRSSQQGFSLLELVVSMIVLALLAAIAVPFVSNGVQAYSNTAATLHSVGKLRYASERITRELREISNVGGNYMILTPVNTAGSNISFVKSDGTTVRIVTTPPNVTLAYDTLAGDTDFILTDEVTGLVFNYFTEDGFSATDVSDVAYIEFDLELDNGNALIQRSFSYSTVLRQRSRIALRNQL